MSFASVVCPLIQRTLVEYADPSACNTGRQPVGFLDSLLSPENKNGFQQIGRTTNGGQQSIDLVYTIPQTLNDIETAPNGTLPFCPPGAEQAMIQPQSITLNVASLNRTCSPIMQFNETAMANFCAMDQFEYRANVLMGAMNSLNRSININLTRNLVQPSHYASSDATTGLWIPLGNAYEAMYTPVAPPAPISLTAYNPAVGTDWTNYYINDTDIITGSPASVDYANFAQNVSEQFRRIRVSCRPIMVGAGTLGISMYQKLTKVGCCNNNGIDISMAGDDMSFFYDLDFSNTLETTGVGMPAGVGNYYLGYAPGTFQLISYNEFTGSMRKSVPNMYEHDTITDPYTGLTYDFQMEYDSRCRTYNMQLCLRYGLFSMPRNMYNAVDLLGNTNNTEEMAGVNGSLLFREV